MRYRAKNIFGWSDYSEVTSIYTIMVPDIMDESIRSELIGTNVIFHWKAPWARGSPIISYDVQV